VERRRGAYLVDIGMPDFGEEAYAGRVVGVVGGELEVRLGSSMSASFTFAANRYLFGEQTSSYSRSAKTHEGRHESRSSRLLARPAD
jgi:hypothetical protein